MSFGAKTVGKSTINEWSVKFRNGDENLSHKKGVGRPKELDPDDVFEVMGKDQSLTLRLYAIST